MKINFHPDFSKAYKKRISRNLDLDKKFKQRFELFIDNPNHPVLRNHQLKGQKRTYRSFSITGDIRVIYYQNNDEIILIDIGSHNQVY